MRGVGGELEDENWRVASTTLVRGVAGGWEDENWRLGSTTWVRGVSGELEDEHWRLCSRTVVRGVAGELEDENWRLGSTTLVHYAPYCGRIVVAAHTCVHNTSHIRRAHHSLTPSLPPLCCRKLISLPDKAVL